jgi:hypothetical protein
VGSVAPTHGTVRFRPAVASRLSCRHRLEWRVHGWGRTTGVNSSRSRRIDMTDPKRTPVAEERIDAIWRKASNAAFSSEDWLETAGDDAADEDEVDDDDDEDEDEDDDDDDDDDAEDDTEDDKDEP